MQATNRRERRGRGQQDRLEQVDSLSDLPQLMQDSIELRTFVVELGNALSQIADLSDQSRVVVEDPRHSVGALAPWGVEFGGLDDMGFEVDNAAHNQRYIKSRRDR